MSYKINVPYSEKDEAKAQGAKWDPEEKTWYIPDGINYNPFIKWFKKDITIIAKNPIYIALNHTSCWKCKKTNPVIALCSEKIVAVDELEKDDITPDEIENNKDIAVTEHGFTTFTKQGFSFFSYVGFIPNELVKIVKQHFPFYSTGYSKTMESKYWTNHCKFCGSIRGDNFLHHEPGGAFFPVNEEEAKQITLIKIPLKYDVGLTGEFSQSTIYESLISKYTSKNTLQEYITKRFSFFSNSRNSEKK